MKSFATHDLRRETETTTVSLEIGVIDMVVISEIDDIRSVLMDTAEMIISITEDDFISDTQIGDHLSPLILRMVRDKLLDLLHRTITSDDGDQFATLSFGRGQIVVVARMDVIEGAEGEDGCKVHRFIRFIKWKCRDAW